MAELFDAYRQFYGREPAPDACSRFVQARLETGDSVLFVALLKSAPVGFTQLYPSFSSIRMGRTYILNDLFVAREARGRGVATALIGAAETFAREAGAVGMDLSTARNNETAQALYRSLGWHRDETFVTFNRSLD